MKKAGLRLALLSNFTPAMLDANVESAGLTALFEAKVTPTGVRPTSRIRERTSWAPPH